jgi:hypothetical protein
MGEQIGQGGKVIERGMGSAFLQARRVFWHGGGHSVPEFMNYSMIKLDT